MRRPRLFHVSEDGGIARFEPRPPPSPDAGVEGPAVWAVAESHLVNYLLPRDCPRICFRAGAQTTAADIATFLGTAGRVVAFEEIWLDRVKAATLSVYELPSESFVQVVAQAGYWISRQGVTPSGLEMIDDALAAVRADAEVRLLQDFWTLADAVAASSLEFSIIRKRNAAARRG